MGSENEQDTTLEQEKPCKKKTRRKKSSKCMPTCDSAIEGAPFKELPDNGITIGIPSASPLPIDKLPNCTGLDIVRYIVQEIDVGVKVDSLVNCDIQKIIDLRPMVLELNKLLKQHGKFRVYQKVVLTQVYSIFSSQDGWETFSSKVVYHTLHRILSYIVPSTLLGSKENFQTFMRSVHRLVHGCYLQSFSLSSMVHGHKVSHIPWLQRSVPSHSLRLHMLARLLKWLHMYAQLCMWKLFHVVSSNCKVNIFYDKSKWQLKERNELSKLVADGKLQMVSGDFKKLAVIGQTKFLVKTHGLRPVTKFRKPDATSAEVRLHARVLLNQLAFIIGCGNTSFSPNIDHVLQGGLLKIIQCYPNAGSRPAYYFVRADVKDAFGSITHLKMLTILSDIQTRYMPRTGGVELCKVIRGQKVIDLFRSQTLPLPISTAKVAASRPHKMFKILSHIRDCVHLVGNVFGKSTFRVRCGISQGMHLSCILCELYYNSLDMTHLKCFRETARDEIFVRYCDDYLLLTPSKERAEQFLQKISLGFPDFNVQFNSSKTVTNVDTETKVAIFCGYEIDLVTFCVQANFSSYENQNIANTMNLRKTKSLGKVLQYRMTIVLKLNPIVLDKRLNSKHAVAGNIYRAALFMAFRLFAFVNSSFPAKKIAQKHLLTCIKVAGKAIRNKVMKVLGRNAVMEGKWFSRDEIKWLTYRAFIARMSKNVNWCSKTRGYLKATCRAMSDKMKPFQLRLLQRMSDPSLPDEFATMS